MLKNGWSIIHSDTICKALNADTECFGRESLNGKKKVKSYREDEVKDEDQHHNDEDTN